jgi:hypothetical protein
MVGATNAVSAGSKRHADELELSTLANRRVRQSYANSPGISSTTNTTAGANVITIPFTQQSGSPTVPTGTCSCGRAGGYATRIK